MWGRDAAADKVHDVRQGELAVIESNDESIEPDRVYHLGPSWKRKGRQFVLLDTTAVEIRRGEYRINDSGVDDVIEVFAEPVEEADMYATEWKALEVEKRSIVEIRKVSPFVRLKRKGTKIVLISVVFVTRT